MNKGILVSAVADRLGVSRAVAKRSVEAVLEEVARSLVRREDVSVTGFGKFSVVKRASYRGRNPRTGEKVQVPETVVVKFAAGARLLEYVSGEKVPLDEGKVVAKAPKGSRQGSGSA
jgi:DNA-binding protein HU-beta